MMPVKNIFAIISGQGLAGTLLAWELWKQKQKFIIVSSPKHSKSSLVAAGMVNPLVFKRFTQSWMADFLLPDMHRCYSEIETVLNQQLYHRIPMLKPLSDQEKSLWLKKRTNPEIGKYIQEIANEPPISGIRDSEAYGILKGSGYLNTSLFLKMSHNFFKEQGLLIEDIINHKDVEPNEAGTSWKSYKAKFLIFCDGHHGAQNPFYPSNCFKLTKGELLHINAEQLSENYIINRRVFVLPIGQSQFKVGSTYEWDTLDEDPTQKGQESILERLDQLITTPYTITAHLAGIRPTIIDRRPIIGIHPEHPSIAFFNGLGTKGVMIGPHFARLMSKLLNSTLESIPEETNILRFFK